MRRGAGRVSVADKARAFRLPAGRPCEAAAAWRWPLSVGTLVGGRQRSCATRERAGRDATALSGAELPEIRLKRSRGAGCGRSGAASAPIAAARSTGHGFVERVVHSVKYLRRIRGPSLGSPSRESGRRDRGPWLARIYRMGDRRSRSPTRSTSSVEVPAARASISAFLTLLRRAANDGPGCAAVLPRIEQSLHETVPRRPGCAIGALDAALRAHPAPRLRFKRMSGSSAPDKGP